MAETSETDLKTFRDFLMQYNSVTEQCFTACVHDLSKREVSDKEERCAKNCLDKFLKMTQRLSMRFQEHQLVNAEAQGATMANESLMLLCEAVLEDHFGYYVKTVAHELFKNEQTLIELRKALRGVCKQSEICLAIATLDLHNLVSFELAKRGVFYKILPDNVLRFIYLPRAINIVKQLYGDLGAKIMKELAFHGRITYAKCISPLLSVHSDSDCGKTFAELAYGMLIRRCDVVISTDTGFPVTQQQRYPFAFEVPAKVKTEETGEADTRKRKLSDEVDADLWCINWEKINHYLHNEMIFNVIRTHKDYNTKDEDLWRSLLLVADSQLVELTQAHSTPISVQEVCRYLKDNYGKQVMVNDANAIFSRLESSGDFPQMNPSIVRRSAESGGGLYIINYSAAVEMFCNEHVESVLRERVDDRAVRIFRLLRMRTNIEEDLLPRMAMLAPKEAKEILYLMIENGYIYTRVIARTNDFASSKAIYFYSYKFPELIDNMTGLCCDSLRNVILRRLREVESNKILLDARQKIDQIIATINENTEISEEDKLAQAEEVEGEYMTEQDKRNYHRHLHSQKRLASDRN
ncbi:DNA-directed RNA polymerase III subunit RPC3 [Aphelenchoides bicaudatus]|nr:DNA-directed RNA polymerase III subunit RPC3 [Aphelenchoides bicaudatus]